MEPKKEPKRDPFRKGPDKKTSPVNNNLILSLLVVGALVIVVVTVFNSSAEYSISSSDLETLVELTDPKSPGDASISISDGDKSDADKPGKTIKYSGVSNLRFAPIVSPATSSATMAANPKRSSSTPRWMTRTKPSSSPC